MMTELDLQEAIGRALEKEILPGIAVFDEKGIKVFMQDIPLSADFEDEDSDEDKYFPCCIVKLRGGKQEKAGEPQSTKVETIICIKDWSRDMSGYKTLMICIQRIRDYFGANAGIRECFRLLRPVKWVVNEEAAVPYFIGSVTTEWSTAVMPYDDIEGFL